ncbi:MAG: Rieske 2Fe-2S domain-containing protein [Nitrososphaerota archaeon]|nr:Rieske 2Fe-2S domain-containing protein [Nitrososphaerota archaeon]
MGDQEDKKEAPRSDPSGNKVKERRDFLKALVALGVIGTIVGVGGFLTDYLTFVPSAGVKLVWPKVKVANIRDLQDLKPINFNYPLTNTPNVLVKLGVKAEKGIGPNEDIVAFSLICQHLGCIYAFVPKGDSPVCNASYKMPVDGGYCCCHGSHYSFTQEGAVIGGPAPRPVPMVNLELDESSGDIFATSMGPPSIFGHDTGAVEPSAVLEADLTGGTEVTDTVSTTQSSTGSTSSSSTITTSSSSSGSGG